MVALASVGAAIALTYGGRDSQIPKEELANLPPIVLVWADAARAKFTAAGDLFVARADAGSPRLIRSWGQLEEVGNGGTYGVRGARWSPDRTWIALNLAVWNSDPDSQVALVRPNGRGLRRLGRSSWTAGFATWSPDGRDLAYTVLGGVWIHSPADGTTRRIWQAQGYRTVDGITWAPDGQRLALAENDRGILVVSADGRVVTRITRRDGYGPEWSPAGSQIAFGGYGSPGAVWTVGARGGTPERLTLGGSQRWSRDGRSLLLTRTVEKRGEYDTEYLNDVYVVSADGEGLRRLTSDGLSQGLTWSPDGTKILFLRTTRSPEKPDTTWSELWVMDADGGRPTRLPFNRVRRSVVSADWGP